MSGEGDRMAEQLVAYLSQAEDPRADVNLRGDEDGKTVLHLAAEHGKAGLLQHLIDEFGADPELEDFRGRTPLLSACVRRRRRPPPSPAVLATLLRRNARPDVVDRKTGRSPLWLCASLPRGGTGPSCCQMIACTLSASPRGRAFLTLADRTEGLSPLAAAARVGNGLTCAILVDAGAYRRDRQDVDIKGRSPLHHASTSGLPLDVLELLVRTVGCEIDLRDADGRTALHLASCARTIEDLIALGAKPDIQDAKGDTRLHLAARSGDLAACEVLLRSSASPSIRNAQGETPHALAAPRAFLQALFCSSDGRFGGGGGGGGSKIVEPGGGGAPLKSRKLRRIIDMRRPRV